MDTENRKVLEEVCREIHSKSPKAHTQNKIYPISDLLLCKQVYSNEFGSVYKSLPNFKYIKDAQEEAFTTGRVSSHTANATHTI